jgi:hypothetical protein
VNITYDKYQKVVGKPDWCVHVLEDGKSRLVFFGSTEAEAMGKAKDWANTNLDTPERREILRQRAEAARERMLKKKPKETA